MLLEDCLRELKLQPGKTYLDCTLGGAGHATEAAKLVAPSGLVIGVDQDDLALENAGARLASLQVLEQEPLLLKGNFGDLDRLLVEAEVPGVDAILFDLGVSSPQFDIPERGFSYREDAPLDMRMDPQTNPLTAAEVVNTYSEAELASILTRFGEERWASRIAQFICNQRRSCPIRTTFELVAIIKAAIPAAARREGGHPAKRTFQALRIEVNHEMEVLEAGLQAAIRWLNPGGRLAVISYHSLEDRIVKDTFKWAQNPCVCPPDLPICTCKMKPILKVNTRRPIQAGALELQENPRSHSAKLRVATKI